MASSPERPPLVDPDTGGTPVVEELLTRIADRSAKIAFLQEMTGALAAAENLGELLDRTAEIAQRHLPYDVCSTHLVDPESGRITVVLGSGPLFEALSTKSLHVGEGVVGWVVENGRLANVPDVTKDSRWIPSATQIKSELAVPILSRGRVLGVFNLESAQPGAFKAYDEQIFSILASQMGSALERVELYREALERAAELNASSEELSRTQDRLIQSAKLAAVGELAAGVAHEINNPLTGILGYTQWVLLELSRFEKEPVSADTADAIRIRLEKIEREVLRCSGIVQNLLNFSRAHDRAVTRPIGMSEVVEATLGVTEHQLGMNKVEVLKELAADLPRVDGNANQLQQVFTNIIINAAKAMPGGGRLTVHTRFDPSSRRVSVSFSDTGVGMSKQVRERIFEPFFTTREVGEGTGLGLSVSYGIVQAHGGEIVVLSEEGKGSTFIVALPVKE